MRRLLTFVIILLHTLTLYSAPATISLNIKVDQFGYRTTDAKIAVIAQPQIGYNAPVTYTPGATFTVRRWDNDVVVFTGTVSAWKNGIVHTQSGDKIWWFDFSSLTTVGDYYVEDTQNGLSSNKFVIHNDVYTTVLRAATHALFYQRCGTAIATAHGGTWTHSACHIASNQDLACRDVETPNNTTTAKDLSGGWHDAGDYNKYVNYTYNAVHNLLFAYQENPSVFTDDWGIPESKNGIPDILDEVKYELDWLIKMQQTNGSVLSKVSVVDFRTASPPNNDISNRFYGKASTSSTLTAASIFAHASLVFKTINPTYSASLLTKAQSAWNWAVANPSVIYQNTGFASSSPEVTTYDILARKIGAAALLFAATNQTVYKSFFESNYTSLHCIQWYYFYSFESVYNDIALFYTTTIGVTASVSADILLRFRTSTANEPEFYASFTNKTDAYRAYMKDEDYVWGNNMQKALMGMMYENMIRYNQNTTEHANYRTQALDYLHYLHGINPLSMCMLSNTGSIGADNFATQIYHNWTGDGTVFDLNPIPGLLTGGCNKDFSVKTISPPANQPIQKSYKNWNTSSPENSWEITEPAISYQGAYIRLLSKYATRLALSSVSSSNFLTQNAPLSIFPNPTQSNLNFRFETPSNIDFSVQIIDHFGKIVLQKDVKSVENQIIMQLDILPYPNGNYYLKITSEQNVYTKQFTISR